MIKANSFIGKYLRKIATLCFVATILATAFISHFRVNSYSVGYKEAILLGKLGIFTGYEEGIDDTEFRDFLQNKATVETAIISLKRMQGAYNIDGIDGNLLNEDEMYLYYKYLDIEGVPVLLAPGSKTSENISSQEAYIMVATALGYTEQDYTIADEQTGELTQNIFDFMMAKGFGFSIPVEKIDELTNGELACIIFEAFYSIPKGADIQVYRIRANINSDFKLFLLENGLYDDIPEEYAPLFVDGIYSQNSFFAFLGENNDGTKPKNEWGAKYNFVKKNEADEYIELLKANGFIMDSQYKMEHDDSGLVNNYIVTLMYKTIDYEYNGAIIEMTSYCVLRFDTDNNVLEWNLLI